MEKQYQYNYQGKKQNYSTYVDNELNKRTLMISVISLSNARTELNTCTVLGVLLVLWVEIVDGICHNVLGVHGLL